MTRELLDVARAIAERARGGEEIEGYAIHEREFSVKTFGGEVESLSAAEPRGVSARVVEEGRTGFAYTTDLSDAGIATVVESARENVRFTGVDEAVALARPAVDPAETDLPGLVDEDQKDRSAEEKVAFALDLERATAAADARIRTVEEAVYADSSTEVAIATSTGIAGAYRRTDSWCYAIAIATDGDDTETGFEFDLARGLGGLDAEGVARRAADKAVRVLGASKIPSARMPVVFDPYTAGQFLAVLGRALTGEAVQKGRSLFAELLGREVASSSLTLIDDGRVRDAPGSAPWDGEGVPTQRTPVIEGGILSSFLYDTTTARREGRSSTGNAARGGFKSAPGPAPSNFALEPTGEEAADVLKRAGAALLVQDFHGVHSGANPVSGDFSVGVTGRLYRDGAAGAPVKGITIALPMLEILKRIEAVGTDRRWLPFGGSFGGSTTLVSEMTVAGE